MIKIYGMSSCPDCTHVWEQVQGDARYEIIDFGLDVRELKAREGYEVIDIGLHVRDLKAFLKLRDHSPAFTTAKARGAAGIPCFVLEDGTVTLSPEDVGLHSLSSPAGGACSLDGSGC